MVSGVACEGTAYCVALHTLKATASSSGSVMLSQQPAGAMCCPAMFEIMAQKRRADGLYEPWRALNTPLFGRRLPLEVLIECEFGCVFKLRSLNASALASKAAALNLNETNSKLVTLQREVFSGVSEEVSTPSVNRAAPYPPAARLQFFLHPPLVAAGTSAMPPVRAARAFIDALVSALDSEHNHVSRNRFSLVEVSTSGSFVICDVLPESLFVTVSGPDVRELEVQLAVKAAGLEVAGHYFDARYGLWQVGVQSNIIHGGVSTAKLWPRLSDRPERSPTGQKHPPAPFLPPVPLHPPAHPPRSPGPSPPPSPPPSLPPPSHPPTLPPREPPPFPPIPPPTS